MEILIDCGTYQGIDVRDWFMLIEDDTLSILNGTTYANRSREDTKSFLGDLRAFGRERQDLGEFLETWHGYKKNRGIISAEKLVDKWEWRKKG